MEGKITLTSERTLAPNLVLRGRTFRVRGTLTPFVAGQEVRVRLSIGQRRVATRRAAVTPSRRAGKGTFAVDFDVRRPARVKIRALHLATPQLARVSSRPLRVSVVRPQAGAGSSGPVVRLLQSRLAALHYAVRPTGGYDSSTANAVMAFRKLTGMDRTTTASEDVFSKLLRGAGAFKVRYPRAGRHIEADLSRQVLALIDGGKVVRIYPTSSGKASTPTVLGSYRVYRKDPGYNSLGMLDSAYFIRGYAIHGYASVPPYPASHGCLRIPIQNARTVYDWLRGGDGVIVYR